MNYNEEMKEIIANLKEKPKLLLHSCCAPCSSLVLEKLKDYFEIRVLYYNPNIEPEEEYLLRKNEQIRLLKILGIPYLDVMYDNETFTKNILGYEDEPENGYRCKICYAQRLNKTAKLALKENFEYFGTTLTISPHKDSQIINEIGQAFERRYKIKFLLSDFKKESGYQRSVELAQKYELYRQNYCGCRYSKGE